MVIWKKIEEFKDYLISSTGKCYSLKSNKLMTPHQYPNGYLFYSFKENGVQKARLIHRLVAKAFIPNPEGKPQVDHINTIKKENNVENLKWCDQSENNLNPHTRHRISLAQMRTQNKHPRDCFGRYMKKGGN